MIGAGVWFGSGEGPTPPPRPPGMTDRSEGESQRKVLIVEDNWLVAVELEAALQDAGYLVVGIAVSADEAVRACGANPPELVLMDIRLLGPRDGIDAAIQLREQFGIGSIFVSAHNDADLRARAEAAQPLGWITKPVTSSALLRSLEQIDWPDGGQA